MRVPQPCQDCSSGVRKAILASGGRHNGLPLRPPICFSVAGSHGGALLQPERSHAAVSQNLLEQLPTLQHKGWLAKGASEQLTAAAKANVIQ